MVTDLEAVLGNHPGCGYKDTSEGCKVHQAHALGGCCFRPAQHRAENHRPHCNEHKTIGACRTSIGHFNDVTISLLHTITSKSHSLLNSTPATLSVAWTVPLNESSGEETRETIIAEPILLHGSHCKTQWRGSCSLHYTLGSCPHI